MLGKILTSFGLGQSDLVEVTQGTCDRINRARKSVQKEELEAMSFALHCMVEELVQRDVATTDTAKAMKQVIDKCLS